MTITQKLTIKQIEIKQLSKQDFIVNNAQEEMENLEVGLQRQDKL